MGKSAPKAPPAVDPTALTKAQTESNLATAAQQQKLGMVNTTGPGGSVKYVNDPSSPGGYTQVTELDAPNNAIYNLGLQAQQGALGVANDQIGRVGDALDKQLLAPELRRTVGANDFSADRQAVSDAVFNQARARLDPMWQQAEDRQRTRLSNQGLSQNSTAYNTSMGNFGRDRNDAYNDATYRAIQAGSDEQNRLFNQDVTKGNFENATAQQGFSNDAFARSQPINDFAALLGTGGSAVMPSTYQGPTANLANTDVLGAYGLSEASKNNAYNAQVSNVNSKNAGLSNLASAILGR